MTTSFIVALPPSIRHPAVPSRPERQLQLRPTTIVTGARHGRAGSRGASVGGAAVERGGIVVVVVIDVSSVKIAPFRVGGHVLGEFFNAMGLFCHGSLALLVLSYVVLGVEGGVGKGRRGEEGEEDIPQYH